MKKYLKSKGIDQSSITETQGASIIFKDMEMKNERPWKNK